MADANEEYMDDYEKARAIRNQNLMREARRNFEEEKKNALRQDIYSRDFFNSQQRAKKLDIQQDTKQNKFLMTRKDPSNKNEMYYKQFRELENERLYLNVLKQDFYNKRKNAKIYTEDEQRPTRFNSIVSFKIEDYFNQLESSIQNEIQKGIQIFRDLDPENTEMTRAQRKKYIQDIKFNFNSGNVIKNYNQLVIYILNFSKENNITMRDNALIDNKFSDLVPNVDKLLDIADINGYSDKDLIQKLLENLRDLIIQPINFNIREGLDQRIRRTIPTPVIDTDDDGRPPRPPRGGRPGRPPRRRPPPDDDDDDDGDDDRRDDERILDSVDLSGIPPSRYAPPPPPPPPPEPRRSTRSKTPTSRYMPEDFKAKRLEKKQATMEDVIDEFKKNPRGRPRGSKNIPKEIDPKNIPPPPSKTLTKIERDFQKQSNQKANLLKEMKGRVARFKDIQDMRDAGVNIIPQSVRQQRAREGFREGEGKGKKKAMKKYNLNEILRKLK